MTVRRWLTWVPLGVLLVEIATYTILTTGAADDGVALAHNDLRLAAIIAAASLVMSVVGCIIITKQPRNAIGWLFAIIPCGFWVKGCSDAITFYSFFARHGSVPGGVVAAWMSSWDYLPAIGTLGTFVPLLFPEGRLPSKRWRIVVIIAIVAIVNAVIATAFAPGKLDSFPEIRNPYAAHGTLGTVIAYGGAGLLLLPVSFLLSALSLWFRARSGSAVLKQQVKWIALAGVFFGLGFGFSILFNFGLIGATLVFVPVTALPVACAIAITRYRLFELDRFISRTLSYAIVTAVLAGAFALIVVVPTALIGFEGGAPNGLIAIGTLAAAFLFRPLRRRVQTAVDRRFNRARYDIARTVEAFASRLRDEIDIETLRAELCHVVARSMHPASVSLWLRPD